MSLSSLQHLALSSTNSTLNTGGWKRGRGGGHRGGPVRWGRLRDGESSRGRRGKGDTLEEKGQN